MPRVPFIKMQGAGNDYVFIDGFVTPCPESAAELAVQVSDRHRGIGSDGLIMMVPPDDKTCDVEMRMWNADGSEGQMCGNGVRCVALWMALQQRVTGACRVRTKSRTVAVDVLELQRNGLRGRFRADMGCPEFSVESGDRLEYLNDVRLPGVEDANVGVVAVSMGNPHAVVFADELTDRNVRHAGRIIECHPRFPGGTNVEWVRVVSETKLHVRVWERGSGETQACGSGACAAAVAAIDQGYCARGEPIQVDLPGGRLEVEWQKSGTLWLAGPAAVSFTGEWVSRADD